MNSDSSEPVIVHRSSSEKDIQHNSLLLQAAGVAHEIRRIEGQFLILVAVADAPRSRAEFDAYAAENQEGSAPRLAVPTAAKGWIGATIFVAVLVLGTVFQQRHVFGVDWTGIGEGDAGLIRHGQWWRTITALTLHSSLEHLVGNVIIGALAGLFAGQLLGSGVAGLAILLGGAAGNFFNAWIRPGWHSSIGASTAVFATLGILAGHAWRRMSRTRSSRMQRWAPLVSGATLLSFFGTAGERTDVGAHVLGFLCGAGIGAFLARKSSAAWSSPQMQIVSAFSAMAILTGAWALALQAPAGPWR